MPDRGEPLLGSNTYRELGDAEFEAFLRAHHSRVFAERFELDLEQVLSSDEQVAVVRLRARLGSPYRLNLGVFLGDEFVGWSFGMQESAERFYMINAGVLPEHRRRGLYSALLPHVLSRVQAQGFQIAYSRHAATNNRVLVPKLRAGFVITGLELSERFGTLVHLSYFFNALRRRVLDVRSGEALPEGQVKSSLRLD
jgi:ribosomal protein S18 acetylase RimI-like enzyme